MMIKKKMDTPLSASAESKLDEMLATWASGVRLSRAEAESIKTIASQNPSDSLSVGWWKNCLRSGSEGLAAAKPRFSFA